MQRTGKGMRCRQVASPLGMISFFRLEPLINIREGRITGYEVLSSLKAGVVPEDWFASLKSSDVIEVLKFQLEYTSSLFMKEQLFFNLSISGLLEMNEKDVKFIRNYSPISIEISDTFNIKISIWMSMSCS
ncbi:hypothetical protein GT614_03375 [Enterobacter hormaechei]|uniref:EAL domain-containing protein n=1 Tax=Enterobacter hormaechei TaxID=158836 RepID=UPI00136ED9BC|nr:EAL domain-containing protein [Enterobacter hormaechei]MCC4570362.1 hypothetical protein [Enterobacter hormaechei subsp. hoffmannii]MCC4573528.1 hypothetical protein [Enterobacter hormaechei subsp. hoffmannii]MCC4578074.1 hypothetical protein [Enterobacter hormaechei subsp. hoffmannii]MCC4583998.1 hypothetical protein [Enterobacter hormaechei subsp. hoffmannii]MZJ51839.1 hypothetical protein [Enterobacter hormaechei]